MCPTAVSPLIRSASSIAVGRGPALEELLDAAVDEPQPGLQLQDGLADDGEPEVAGLDQPGVHRADRDLVHARRLRPAERERAVDVAERRWVAGVARASGTSRGASASAGPAGWAAGDRRGRCRTGRGSPARTGRRGRTARPGWGHAGRAGSQRRCSSTRRSVPAGVNRYTTRSAVAVLVAGDQREPVTRSSRTRAHRHEFSRANGDRDAVLADRLTDECGGHGAVPVTTAAACASSGASGPRVSPSTAQAMSAVISAQLSAPSRRGPSGRGSPGPAREPRPPARAARRRRGRRRCRPDPPTAPSVLVMAPTGAGTAAGRAPVRGGGFCCRGAEQHPAGVAEQRRGDDEHQDQRDRGRPSRARRRSRPGRCRPR